MDFDVIDVPYISQWDADAHLARGDCGIVSACMIARWLGIETSPDAMLGLAGLPVGKLTYTIPEIIRSAAAVGVTLSAVRPAVWSTIQRELQAGRPSITLLRYGGLSGNQDDGDFAHFWVNVGFDDKHVIVNDPNFWGARRDEGMKRRVRLIEYEKAIGDALNFTGNMSYQSLFLARSEEL